jgi:hypothetical protein
VDLGDLIVRRRDQSVTLADPVFDVVIAEEGIRDIQLDIVTQHIVLIGGPVPAFGSALAPGGCDFLCRPIARGR